MSQLQDFDREEELEIFLQMLSAERQERLLDVCAGGGTGKSYLLRRMRQECSAQDVPCALAEFASTWQPDPPKLMRELGDRHGEGNSFMGLGNVYYSQGRWAQAIKRYQESLRIFRELGDRHGEGWTLNNLGLVYKVQGRWDQATECYRQAHDISRELGDRHGGGTAHPSGAGSLAAGREDAARSGGGVHTAG
jgi:tetratricopeptide (TPR) repeat protein